MEYPMREKNFNIVNSDLTILEELKKFYEAQSDCKEITLDKMPNGVYKLSMKIVTDD